MTKLINQSSRIKWDSDHMELKLKERTTERSF